jgi:hypothetical protein
MKKLAVFFLLTLFLFNTVGYYVVFKITQAEIKVDVKLQLKRGIPATELTEIKIDLKAISTIQWVEKNKEFYYNNQLYDVVKTSTTDNTITFYCITDKKEEVLFAHLDDYIKTHVGATNNHNSTSKKLSTHVLKVYFLNSFSLHFSETVTEIKYCIFKTDVCTAFSKINSPPPQFS